MIHFTDAQTVMQDLTSDTSSGSLTQLKRFLNIGYHEVLASLGRAVTEKTQTASTVASQQFYQLPSNALFIKSVTVTVGSIPYPLEEIIDQEMWNALNADITNSSDIPTFFFVRPGFGINGTEVGIFPKPASASNTITIVYESGDKDLTASTYSTGTVTLANGDATVTGAGGATFTEQMVGRYFKATTDGVWYRIASFTSSTSIELENVYEGIAGGSLAYVIEEAFNLPEDLHMLPIYWAVSHYYEIKQEADKAIKYMGLYKIGLLEGKRRWGFKTRNRVFRGKPRFQLRNPNFPPSTMS